MSRNKVIGRMVAGGGWIHGLLETRTFDVKLRVKLPLAAALVLGGSFTPLTIRQMMDLSTYRISVFGQAATLCMRKAEWSEEHYAGQCS